MSSAELLKPRYKVIADFLGNEFLTVGEIITNPEYYKRRGDDLDKWPHLFRKLSWYEEMSPDNAPDYIKNENGVYAVEKWDSDDEELFCFLMEDINGNKEWYPRTLNALPATEQEFINFKEKQQ